MCDDKRLAEIEASGLSFSEESLKEIEGAKEDASVINEETTKMLRHMLL